MHLRSLSIVSIFAACAACSGGSSDQPRSASAGAGGAAGTGSGRASAGHGGGTSGAGTTLPTTAGSGGGTVSTGSTVGAGSTGGGPTGSGWNLGVPSAACDTGASSAALTVSVAHPRLWWTPDRLATARSRYTASPWTPDPSNPLELALHYVVSGNTSSARAAIDRLMALTIPLEGTASDPIRWYGEWAISTYDWCFDQMTADERATIFARWNTAVDYWSRQAWGGVGMEADNYYWGYLRNELLWGIATYYEGPSGPAFVQHALQTRLTDSFAPYAAGEGRGGVPTEGTQYGPYMLGYPVIGFTTSADDGRGLFSETNFHCEAVYYLIYGTTPGTTTRTVAGVTVTGMDMFPFNDDQMFGVKPIASSSDYAGFASAMAMAYPASGVGRHARAWIDHAGAPVPRHVQAVDPGGPEASFDSLPLDYYAPGPGFHYARTSWAPGATALNLQLGRPGRVGHSHLDAGSFQIWRGGRWLSRESTGYADTLVGYGGALVGTELFSAHNVVAFEGRALATGSDIEGPPVVLRLESQAAYTFAAVDLTPAYRAHDAYRPERDTPWAASVVREFLFVRPLETLVILDRMTSQDANGIDASHVVKTSIVHFENPPQIVDANHVSAVDGDQALQLTTLAPSTPSYTVTAEGGVGQYRLDIETSGAPTSYLLDVLQAKDAAGADVQASITEDANGFVVTLVHPTLGTAVVTFAKGPTSSGGTIGYAASGVPATLSPLRADVQAIHVGTEGPYWTP